MATVDELILVVLSFVIVLDIAEMVSKHVRLENTAVFHFSTQVFQIENSFLRRL
jgi:hypothetical protein